MSDEAPTPSQSPFAAQAAAVVSPEESARLAADFKKYLISRQTPMRGLGMAVLAAIVGTIIWVLVVWTTKYKIGYLAVGIGFLVGFSIRYFGKNVESKYAYIGGALAVISCMLGNIFAQCALAAEHEHVPFLGVCSHLTPALALEIIKEGFVGLDLLFYGLAIWAGYQYAFRKVNVAEFEAFQATQKA